MVYTYYFLLKKVWIAHTFKRYVYNHNCSIIITVMLNIFVLMTILFAPIKNSSDVFFDIDINKKVKKMFLSKLRNQFY